MILVYVICKDIKEAKKIGLFLLKKRLVACYNIWPVDSAYWWRGKMVKDKESVLLLKSQDKHYKEIENVVKKMHRNEVPCIFSLKPGKIERNYLKWLYKETR